MERQNSREVIGTICLRDKGNLGEHKSSPRPQIKRAFRQVANCPISKSNRLIYGVPGTGELLRLARSVLISSPRKYCPFAVFISGIAAYGLL